MADDEQSTSGMVCGLVQDFTAQLRAVTERWKTWPDPVRAVRWHPAHSPLPGALSAAQLAAISGSVAAQRRSSHNT